MAACCLTKHTNFNNNKIMHTHMHTRMHTRMRAHTHTHTHTESHTTHTQEYINYIHVYTVIHIIYTSICKTTLFINTIHYFHDLDL